MNQPKHWQTLPIWLGALLLLALQLGTQGIMGSEARWTEVTREMFLTGDYLHPTVNFEPYFDKPLLSYWLIALAAFFHRPEVSEWAARIPSVLAALATLGCTMSIARRLWTRQTAILTGYLAITTYSFLFWGRLAEADMINLAFSTAAIAWFVRFREKGDFIAYGIFFGILAVGSHAKGLGAAVVPLLVVLADLIISKTWKNHLKWQLFLAAACGVGVYLIPFALAKWFDPAIPVSTQSVIDADGTVKTSGLALAIRENVIRFFAPFDHNDEPFFCYFIHVPRLLLPWSPIFVMALIHAWLVWRKNRNLTRNTRWLLLSIGLIFLFFSISGSRRHYYILPIVPYAWILSARYLEGAPVNRMLERIKRILLGLYEYAPLVAAAIAVAAAAALMFRPCLLPVQFNALHPLLRMLSFAVVVIFVLLAFWQYKKEDFFDHFDVPYHLQQAISAIIAMFLVMGLVFSYAIPLSDQLRTERPAIQAMASLFRLQNTPDSEICFYPWESPNVVYYLGRTGKITSLRTPEELERKMNSGASFWLIAQERYLAPLPESLQARLPLLIQEPHQAWEKSRPAKSKKWQMRRFEPSTTTKSPNKGE